VPNLFSLVAQNKISSRNLFFATHAREKFSLRVRANKKSKTYSTKRSKKNFLANKKNLTFFFQIVVR
jgi:hypothetical protein